MMASKSIVLLVTLVNLLIQQQCRADDGSNASGIINKLVNTALDLTSHLAKFTVSVTVENKGEQSVAHVLYLVDPLLVDDLAFISAEVSLHSGSHYVTCTVYSLKGIN